MEEKGIVSVHGSRLATWQAGGTVMDAIILATVDP